MLRLELPGKKRRGRSKRKFIDVVREDMRAIGVKEQDVRDRHPHQPGPRHTVRGRDLASRPGPNTSRSGGMSL